MQVDITTKGYLIIPADMAATYFPNDVLIAMVKTPELWLLPMRGAAGGGLLLKQRNPAGDRSVLIWEALPEDTPSGTRAAFWDAERGAVRVALDVLHE